MILQRCMGNKVRIRYESSLVKQVMSRNIVDLRYEDLVA